ncbi:MAG TPA: hypothetical protein VNV43_00235 [Candidatus Acidoferrales bacterium]|nr:hypothetical protein [Candidatus Acidoferrales bacterium]
MLFNLIRPFLTWPAIQSLIRHGLTSGGALLISKGLASNEDVAAAIGALMVMLGFGHSIWQKWQAMNPPAVSTPLSVKIPILFLPLAVAILLGAGCASTGPQQVTYQAAGTTIVSVDAAMNEWGTYVAMAHPGTNAEIAVESAYEKYQSTMAVACDLGATYSATGGTNVFAALDQAIQNSSQELTDLETLIASFGVKLQ